MKYLKRFNESLTQKELKEVKYDIEDVLVDLDDLNIKRSDEILYKIDTYSNSSSMRSVSISEVFRIDVRFWKNGGFFGFEDFEQLKTIFDRLVRVMEPHSNSVYFGDRIDLAIQYWNDDQENESTTVSYKPGSLNKDWFYSIRNIVGFKLKFNLDK
jgi:hypothetical protein